MVRIKLDLNIWFKVVLRMTKCPILSSIPGHNHLTPFNKIPKTEVKHWKSEKI